MIVLNPEVKVVVECLTTLSIIKFTRERQKTYLAEAGPAMLGRGVSEGAVGVERDVAYATMGLGIKVMLLYHRRYFKLAMDAVLVSFSQNKALEIRRW